MSAADTAQVRVLHASPDAPAVDVYLDDAKVDALTNVPFGTISGLPSDPRRRPQRQGLRHRHDERPVIDADVTVATGKKYTIAATDAVAAIAAQVLEDTPAPSCTPPRSGSSTSAPTRPRSTSPRPAPRRPTPSSRTWPTRTASDYLALPGGSYDLEVRLAGTTTVALALPDVAVEDCNSYSVFAIGSAASTPVGGNALQVVVAR